MGCGGVTLLKTNIKRLLVEINNTPDGSVEQRSLMKMTPDV